MKCESLVYLNQVFSDLEAPSCPLPGELTADSTTFTQQLSFYDPADIDGCGCGCNCGCGCGCGCGDNGIDFTDDLTFVIENTQVFVTNFALTNPEGLTAGNVTLNGLPVDTLTVAGDRFTATTDAVETQITNCACLERGQSTKAMLLIQGAGPWTAKLTIVVYGSIFGCGTCKKFRLVMTTREGVSIDIPGTSTFAVSQLCLPCTKAGIAPEIQFSFLAKATLLNPVITTDTGSGPCNVILSGALVAEPAAAIQVTRETLFTIDAAAVPQPCDDLARCNQAPGTCTCAADFPVPASPCCDDGCGGGEGNTCDGAGTTSGGCSCSCGCGGGDDCGCQKTQICCQFNGVNGCSL